MTDLAGMSRTEMLALLQWQLAAGCDIAIGELPIDRFAQAREALAARKEARPEPRPLPPVDGPSASGASDAGLVADAAALAASAPDLATLRTLLDGYDGCALKLRATQLVFADGNPDAEIMLIGEAPGRDEDLQGRPFVGRSGQLLDRMLAAIGLDRSTVYIANTVPWRPPGNRTPTPAEIAVCLPFLYRQIELVAPRIVVTLGAAATQTLFETGTSMSRLRGQWRNLTLGRHGVAAMPTWHPAYLLRQPAQKAQAWRDMLALKERINGGGI